MITYNHENFIAQAIEGVVMQKTKFIFDLIISDDYSTDNTSLIIKEYKKKFPDIIKPIFRNHNIGSINNFIDTFNYCTGKYIALCEGDDFWTDPYKLQKQVDFLEANPEYGMVYTGIQVVDSNNNIIFEDNSKKPSGEIFYDLLKSAFIVTCSTCFRRELANEAIKHSFKNNLKCMFDYWLWLHIAIRSKVHYISDITSAYRSHSGGVSKVKGFFKEILPLAVLDAVLYKTINFPEKSFKKKWELYINYCRALTASALNWKDRIRYFRFLLYKPLYLFAFFPAIWRKIKLRFFTQE